jgi:hypothetical protein
MLQQPKLLNPGKPFLKIVAVLSLALPFILVIFYTNGLKNPLPTYHGMDELTYHYPIIKTFARQFPYFDLTDYKSATTPFFHIVFATISKLIGLDLVTLRFINVLFSYGAILMLYFILVQRFKARPSDALLYAIAFELSPYFFGVSFILLTDNLSVFLFTVFSYFYFKYKENAKFSTFILSMVFLSLTILTRQIFLYAGLPVVLDILMKKNSLKIKARDLTVAFFAVIPFLILIFVWKGLTPPSFNQFAENSFLRKRIFTELKPRLINLRSVGFGLAVVGFYSIFLMNRNFYLSLFEKKRALIVLTAISIFFMILVPIKQNFIKLPYLPYPTVLDDGFLWHISRAFPDLLGSSSFFYLFVPLGFITVYAIWKKTGWEFKLLALASFLLSNIPNNWVFQKYYDVSIMMLLIFITGIYKVSDRFEYLRIFTILICFIVYFITSPMRLG